MQLLKLCILILYLNICRIFSIDINNGSMLIAKQHAICNTETRNSFSNSAWINEIVKQIERVVSNLQVGNSSRTLDRFAEGLVNSFLGAPPTKPWVSLHEWWGHGDRPPAHPEDTYIRPFTFKFDPCMAQDLLHRIRNRMKFTRSLHGVGNSYGFNANLLDRIMDYWQADYNFASREAHINQYPHYKTRIQGLDLHFIHLKAKSYGRKVVPILVLHGWPSNNREGYDYYPLLTEPRAAYDFVFEVVAPDLPGFGLSQGTSKAGLAPYQIAIILRNLMRRLGHSKFIVQGGDVGAIIASDMAVLFPEELIGHYTNLPYSVMPKTLVKYALGAFFPYAVVEPQYANRMYPLSAYIITYIREFGYFHQQATKPDSIGLALEDSPSGLAAYVIEKFVLGKSGTNQCLEDGGLPRSYRIDDLLDIVTIMWTGKSITTSMRLYAETTAVFQDKMEAVLQILMPSQVPFAAVKFQNEIIYQPDNFLRDKYPNLLHSTTVEFGSHFATLDTPEFLASDVWEATGKFLNYHREKTKTEQL